MNVKNDKKMYIGLRVNYLFLFDFNKTVIFLGRISKNTKISHFMKITPVGFELLHADGRTDMTKLIVAFCQFCKRTRKELTLILLTWKIW